MVNQNFTVVRGNSLQFRVNFTDIETLPDNISLICKNKSSDTTTIFSLELEEGITKVDDEDSYDFYVSPDITSELQLLNYIYQINVTFGIDPITIVEGKLIITPEL